MFDENARNLLTNDFVNELMILLTNVKEFVNEYLLQQNCSVPNHYLQLRTE